MSAEGVITRGALQQSERSTVTFCSPSVKSEISVPRSRSCRQKRQVEKGGETQEKGNSENMGSTKKTKGNLLDLLLDEAWLGHGLQFLDEQRGVRVTLL